mgnify:CR=1 FL=1
MSRPIKFRVWDTENAKMLPWEEIWYSVVNIPEAMVGGGVPWIAFLTMAMIAPDTKYVAEQWTGLLDSKGVEIYEGDIIEVGFEPRGDPDNHILYIEHRRFYGGFRLGAIKPDGKEYDYYGSIPEADCNDVHVIGNIHQHPELLKT